MRSELGDILWSIFGDDPFDDGVEETARRVSNYWKEFYGKEDLDFKLTTFPADVDQMIAVKDIEFSSLCAHHLLPMFGVAHVAYIPNKLMIGLSKIPRVVDHFATRPQVQERLTEQIADYLKDKLEAMGVAVVIEARHTCMACRGVRKHNGKMVTSKVTGVFMTAESARTEFLKLIV